MKIKPAFFLLSLTFLLTLLFGPGQKANLAAQEEEPLKIAIKDIKPFVFTEDGEKVGFSIELWQILAEEAGLPYEFIEVNTVTEQLDAVAQGEADAAIAAISMTAEREQFLDFSYTYFDSGLRIMTRSAGFLPLRSLLEVMFSREVISVFIGLFFVIIIFGHLVWLFERRRNEHFPQSYFRGVWEGIWWAAVTVTTVGYGDKTPRAVIGRILALVWMFIGLVLIANFTATITTQLTLNELRGRIQGVEDLPGKHIATVTDSTSAEFLRRNGISFEGVDQIEEAYELLKEEKIDAIVYDAPVLMFHVSREDRADFQIVGDLLDRETYGIALPTDSPYEEDINQALLTLRENGTYTVLYKRWFGYE
jgi:ABC-type amino acid transport substrate-binding protein